MGEELEKKLKLSAAERMDLEKATRGQSESERWHAEHVGRLTSSMVHRVTKRRACTQPDILVGDIMHYRTAKKVRVGDPRAHGLRSEDQGRHAYVRHQQKMGKVVSVEQCGLFVDDDYPCIAASTDGIITEHGTAGKGVLEIKCPAKAGTILEFAQSKTSCLAFSSDGQFSLKRSHSYYRYLWENFFLKLAVDVLF